MPVDEVFAYKVALGVITAVTVAYAINKIHSKKKQQHLDKFQQVAVLTSIYIYPVKSCRGILVSSSKCKELGLSSDFIRDREFVIVDKDGNFLTARQLPPMVRIVPSVHQPNQLWLDAPEMETFKLTLPLTKTSHDPTLGQVVPVRVFKDMVNGMDCGVQVSQWLSKYLGQENVRLVRFHLNKSSRVPEQNGLWERLRLTDNSIYADLTAYMLLSEASLDDLNSKLNKKVTIRNFRPNFVVQGCSSFAEESWKDVKIGDVQFRQVKPCTRCVFTTVDPETGVKDGVEPLKTLKSYRQITDPKYRKLAGESPVFGVHLQADVLGELKVGQPVFATT